MTREEAISRLKKGEPFSEIYDSSWNEALDMAIASLKTDEAYQLEYENRDFVEISKGMTNGEVINVLFPNVNVLYDVDDDITTIYISGDFWDAPYIAESEE